MRPRPVHVVSVVNAHARRRVSLGVMKGIVRRVLRGERVGRAALTVIYSDSPRCRKMNREFLGHDEVTDVISFCLEPPPELEGEVYVNLDRARQQARRYGVSIASEIARLTVHGTLHLVGYDDRTVLDAQRMQNRQEAYLQSLQKGR